MQLHIGRRNDLSIRKRCKALIEIAQLAEREQCCLSLRLLKNSLLQHLQMFTDIRCSPGPGCRVAWRDVLPNGMLKPVPVESGTGAWIRFHARDERGVESCRSPSEKSAEMAE